jgi:hypothetical protein
MALIILALQLKNISVWRRRTVDKYENLEKVKRLDFDRLDSLVSERLGALKIYAQNVGKTESAVHDAICRDLILPCVYLLAEFLDSVKIGDGNDE